MCLSEDKDWCSLEFKEEISCNLASGNPDAESLAPEFQTCRLSLDFHNDYAYFIGFMFANLSICALSTGWILLQQGRFSKQ